MLRQSIHFFSGLCRMTGIACKNFDLNIFVPSNPNRSLKTSLIFFNEHLQITISHMSPMHSGWNSCGMNISRKKKYYLRKLWNYMDFNIRMILQYSTDIHTPLYSLILYFKMVFTLQSLTAGNTHTLPMCPNLWNYVGMLSFWFAVFHIHKATKKRLLCCPQVTFFHFSIFYQWEPQRHFFVGLGGGEALSDIDNMWHDQCKWVGSLILHLRYIHEERVNLF